MTGFSVVAWVLFMVSGAVRSFFIKGSRNRYLATTVAWALVYPALGIVFTGAIRHAAEHAGFPSTLIDGSLLVIWLIQFHTLKKSGDDNWFHRTGTKLRNRLRERLAAHLLTPIPTRD